MNKVKDNLIDLKELLSDPAHWTKGSMAKKNGEASRIKEGDCFCLLGGINKVTGSAADGNYDANYWETKARVLHSILDLSLGCSIVQFNDTEETTHEQVMAVIDHAIEYA